MYKFTELFILTQENIHTYSLWFNKHEDTLNILHCNYRCLIPVWRNATAQFVYFLKCYSQDPFGAVPLWDLTLSPPSDSQDSHTRLSAYLNGNLVSPVASWIRLQWLDWLHSRDTTTFYDSKQVNPIVHSSEFCLRAPQGRISLKNHGRRRKRFFPQK